MPDPIVTLNAALVAAMADMSGIGRDKTAKVEMKGGGSYSYKYTDLATVFDHVRPILAKHGLGIVQDVQGLQGGMIGVSTILVHGASGERMIFGPLPMPSGGTPQALGSAITYARRYALLAALGIATEDDDGQTARTEQLAPTPPVSEPSFSKAAMVLFDKVKAQKGTSIADELKELAQSNNMKLTAAAFDRDRVWAEIVEATIDGAELSDRTDAAHDAGML